MKRVDPMLNFSKVSLTDKELFNKYFSKYNKTVSELCFSNILMYRDCHNFTYDIINNYLLIHSNVHFEKRFMYFPLGQYNEETFLETILTLKEYFRKDNLQLELHLITTEQLEIFKTLSEKHPGKISLKYELDRDNSDYLYLTSELIELKGKKFDAKRNHIHHFQNENVYEYHKISRDNIHECQNILEKWCQVMDCSFGDYLPCEKRANLEILENYEYLNSSGCLIKVNDTFEAYSIGELLNADTAVIHIEKANINYKGLYQLINQKFCQNQWSETTYINREQDLGLPGLRKAKESYNPVCMVDKYIVWL